MHKLKVAGLGLVMLLIGIGAGFLLAAALLSGREVSERTSVRQEPMPKLWSDDDGARAIEALGYDEAYLFRWRGGAVDGWLELDVGDGPKRMPLDDTLRAGRPDEKPGRLDPMRLSGFLL